MYEIPGSLALSIMVVMMMVIIWLAYRVNQLTNELPLTYERLQQLLSPKACTVFKVPNKNGFFNVWVEDRFGVRYDFGPLEDLPQSTVGLFKTTSVYLKLFASL